MNAPDPVDPTPEIANARSERIRASREKALQALAKARAAVLDIYLVTINSGERVDTANALEFIDNAKRELGDLPF